jgi:hypothetical protein
MSNVAKPQDYGWEISAKTDEFDKTISDILNTKYEISVAIDAKMDSDIDEAFDIA